MHNAIKPPMHNLVWQPQTPNLINKGIRNARGQGLISRSASNMDVECKYFLTHKKMVQTTK
jgi:hypothetical protein